MKYLLPIFFLVVTACITQVRSVEAQTTTFKTVDEMIQRAGKHGISYNANGYYAPDDGGGGNFYWDDTSTVIADAGSAFQVAGVKTGRWLRVMSSPVNLRWFGAKGEGLSSLIQDSKALRKSIAYIAKTGGGILFIPECHNYYAYRGEGIVLPDNIEISGNGNASHIRVVDPSASTYYRGPLFLLSTYGPNGPISLFSCPKYSVQPSKRGSSVIVLKKRSDMSHFYAGKLIGNGSGVFFKNDDPNEKRWLHFELNKVKSINQDTIFLKYPLSEDMPGRAFIVDVNNNGVMHPKLHLPMHISSNVNIHDLLLSQAETNEVETKGITKFPTGILGTGGSFESKIHDVTLKGFIGFAGNMFCRMDIYNLSIYANQKIMDFGYNSHNTSFHDIKMFYEPSKAFDRSIFAIYINEGSHDLEMYNVTASGNWQGNGIFQIAGGAHRINIHNVDIDFPIQSSVGKNIILLNDDNDSTYISDITLKNITIKVNSCKQWIKADGKATVPENRNILFDNVKFVGGTSNADYAVYINRMGNINLRNVTVPNGDTIFVANNNGAVIENLYAPNSHLKTTGKPIKRN